MVARSLMGTLDERYQGLFKSVIILRATQQTGIPKLHECQAAMRTGQFGDLLGRHLPTLDERAEQIFQMLIVVYLGGRALLLGAFIAQMTFTVLALDHIGDVNRGGLFFAGLANVTHRETITSDCGESQKILESLYSIVNHNVIHHFQSIHLPAIQIFGNIRRRTIRSLPDPNPGKPHRLGQHRRECVMIVQEIAA